MASKVYTPTSVNIIQVANRIGTVPVLGSLVGPLRCTIGLIVALATGLFLLIKWICGYKNSEDIKTLCLFSFGHTLLGLAEIVPILGTIAHLILSSARTEKGCESIYWQSFYL